MDRQRVPDHSAFGIFDIPQEASSASAVQDIDQRLSDEQQSQLSKLIDVAFELRQPYGELRPSDQRLTVRLF